MSSSGKPPADSADEVHKTKPETLHTATKSTPHINQHHNDTSKTDKKQVNRSSKFSQSDASIVKLEESTGAKKKIRVWACNSGKKSTDVPDVVETGLVADMDNLNFNNPESVEENWVHSELVRARDSLENLNSSPRNSGPTTGDVGNSKSTNFPQDKFSLNENSPYSDSALSSNNTDPSNSGAKSLIWDPWNKQGRKAKKETKRRKMAEKYQASKAAQDPTHPSQEPAQEKQQQPAERPPEEDMAENYEYQRYQHPFKTVEFISDVMVVYFNGDEVVREGREPLKKEIEQQLRNKEMRKGHLPTMLGSKRKFPEDYRGNWY